MGKNHDFTDEELAKLPPAERAALEEPLSESEERLAKGGPGIEHVDPNAKKEEAEPEPKVEAKPAAAPAKAAPAAADPDTPEDTPDTSASERKPFAVPYQAPAVDPAKVKAELDALDQKYEDGEITLRQRDDSRDAINRAVLKAEVASESEEQVRKGLWFSEVDRFVEKNPVYKDDVLYNALDREVRKIASDPKNADLKDHEVLGKAHEHLATRFKVDSGKPVAKDPVKELRLKRRQDVGAQVGPPGWRAGVRPVIDAISTHKEHYSHGQDHRRAGRPAKAVQRFSAFLATDTARKSYFNKKFMGDGPDAEMPIQMLRNLENDAGDKISYDLVMQLKMQPVEGDDTSSRARKRTSSSTPTPLIDQARGGVNTGGG
jgi:hypothetical protein